MGKVGIILVGHGSSKEFNAELLTKTAALIEETHPEYLVRCAFMWLSKPAIPEILDLFKEDDIDSLVVLPLFLTRGVHIDEDIPRILQFSSGQKKGTFQLKSRGIPIVLANPIGENPILAELMEKSAQKALSLI